MSPIRCIALLFLAVVTSCAANSALAPAHSADLRSLDLNTINEIGESAVRDDGIVGLSIAISLRGQTLFATGFGHADLERARPATAQTVYDIASVGKQFTAVAALKLIDAGQLALDDRLYDLVPQTPRHFPNATVKELLHHTSGFLSGKYDDLAPPAGLDKPRPGPEVLDSVELNEGEVVFMPSESFTYCNSGYLMLGLVVEAAARRPFAEFVAKQLLEPAGMATATVCGRPDSPLMSDSLHRTEQGVARVPFVHMSTYGGPGSVCASVTDLLAWEPALEQGHILSPSSFEQFRTPLRVQGSHASAEIPYGMGQRLGSYRGYRKVGHTGTFAGGSAVLTHYPEVGLTIAVLSNTRGLATPHASSIESELATALLKTSASDEEVRSVPLSSTERQQIEGFYRTRSQFEARIEGDHTLVILQEGKETARVTHTGGLVFRDPKFPHAKDWFLLDGDRAGWWAYEANGLLMSVHRRVDKPDE